jgi:hypothetical protein
MTRRFLTDPRKTFAARPDSMQLGRWERELFVSAVYFTVIKAIPRVRREREVYSTFPEAVAAAKDWRDAYGRTALIYAVNAQDRFFCVDRDLWPYWLTVWEVMKGE